MKNNKVIVHDRDRAPSSDRTVVIGPSPQSSPTRLQLIGGTTVNPERTLKLLENSQASSRLQEMNAPTEAANAAAIPETPADPAAAPAPVPLNRFLVTAYKFVGFGILSIILVGLLSYLSVNAFYFLSSSWIVPTSLSPADEHVLQLDSIKSQESAAKGALETQRLQLSAQLADARRIFESEKSFQDGFRTAMLTDLGDRKAQLKKLGGLLKSYAASKYSIQRSNDAFAAIQRGNLNSQYDAHVIDQEQMLQGNYQVAQMAGANLALDAKHVEIDTQAADLQRQIDSLQNAGVAAQNGDPTTAQYSYEILHMKHEFDLSVLASKKAQDDAVSLKMSIALLDKTIAQHDEMLETIQHSPYMMAADKSYTMAFVPYENKDKVVVGTPVYGCKVGFLFCWKAGSVAELVEGEVVAKHPLRNKDLRGVMVRLNLSDQKAIESQSLFLGHKPIGI